jgi:hypothetical protein
MVDEKPAKDSDEKRFNDTLKRMLETPPKPHDKPGKGEGKEKSEGKRPTN